MTTLKLTPRQSRRWLSDPRCDSQLSWLRKVAALTLNEKRIPSDSTLIRRALARYAEHWADLLAAGRLDGLTGPHPQDAEAERALLAEYASIAAAPSPETMVDGTGRVLTWQESLAEAMQRRDARTFAIPTPPADAAG